MNPSPVNTPSNRRQNVPRRSKPKKAEDDPPKEKRARDWREHWKAFDITVNFNDDDSVLEAMRDLAKKLCMKQVPVSIVKTFAYLAQTAHKILVDKSNWEERISELERIARINVATRNGIKTTP